MVQEKQLIENSREIQHHRQLLDQRIRHSSLVVEQRDNDLKKRSSPEYFKMNKDEIKLNRKTLKVIKAEKLQGKLKDIYTKTAFPKITNF